MSFFRPAYEVSQSEDSEAYSEASITSGSGQPISSALSRGQSASTAVASSGIDLHRDVLLHSLLEEKCLNDTVELLNSRRAPNVRRLTKTDRAVVAQAKQRYRALAEHLVRGGLLHGDLHQDQYDHLRQTARAGVDALSSNFAVLNIGDNNRNGLGLPPRRLLQDEGTNTALAPYPETTQSRHQLMDVVPQLMPSHPLLDSARYTRDFEELGFLDKGGFGSVYRVSHRLDGRAYAIKKVVLSPAVVNRVQQKGQQELDSILSELRLMAKVEHPNLVRYFSAWVEWSSTGLREASAQPASSQWESETDSVEVGADAEPEVYDAHFDHFAADSTGDEVLFEVSSAGTTSGAAPVSPLAGVGKPDLPSPRGSFTKSTMPTLSDEEIEEISRSSLGQGASENSSDQALLVTKATSALVLHIQMSLYPLTLAQYIHGMSPEQTGGDDWSGRHCFHMPASARLLGAILGGVECLHTFGIVHCDLKPANVFLTPVDGHAGKAPMGSICLGTCSGCAAGEETSTNSLHMKVCVGDFGLASPSVSSSAGPGPGLYRCAARSHRPVGTELYRPPEVLLKDSRGTIAEQDTDMPGLRTAHPSQDVYAMGIIFVELLNRFATRMERGTVLRSLRQRGEWSTLPMTSTSDEACKLVTWMLDPQANHGNLTQLRERLIVLAAT